MVRGWLAFNFTTGVQIKTSDQCSHQPPFCPIFSLVQQPLKLTLIFQVKEVKLYRCSLDFG